MMMFIQLSNKYLFSPAVIIILAACSQKTIQEEKQPISVIQAPTVEEPRPDIEKKDEKKFQQALTSLKNGQYDAAEKTLLELKSKHPEAFGLNMNLGIVYLKKLQWPDAEKSFLNAKSLQPNRADVMNYLGIVYREQGKFQLAESAYLKAIELDESYAKAYLNLGILYDLYLSNYSSAKTYYEKFSLFSPDNKKIKDWLVDLEHQQKK